MSLGNKQIQSHFRALRRPIVSLAWPSFAWSESCFKGQRDWRRHEDSSGLRKYFSTTHQTMSSWSPLWATHHSSFQHRQAPTHPHINVEWRGTGGFLQQQRQKGNPLHTLSNTPGQNSHCKHPLSTWQPHSKCTNISHLETLSSKEQRAAPGPSQTTTLSLFIWQE